MEDFDRTSKGFDPNASLSKPPEGHDNIRLSGKVVPIEVRQGLNVLIDGKRTEDDSRSKAPKQGRKNPN